LTPVDNQKINQTQKINLHIAFKLMQIAKVI